MISVEEATQLVLARGQDFGSESLPTNTCTGRILAEDLYADRDFPPFDRVTLDGIAISADGLKTKLRCFQIEGRQHAGEPPRTRQEPDGCIEVMTGAVLPLGTDLVIPVEDLELRSQTATLFEGREVQARQGVHPLGSDRKAGELLVPAGIRISGAELGIAATLGKSRLAVRKQPRITILTTGDELVPIEDTPLPYQIRRSNGESLRGILSAETDALQLRHVPDDPAALEQALAERVNTSDAILLCGGVSRGKKDYVPDVLAKLGVEKIFHRVRQKPGKPLYFGQIANTVIFGLPGNPVSTACCAIRYVLPWIRQSQGLSPLPACMAGLKSDQTPSTRPARLASLTHFLPGKLQLENGCIEMFPLHGNTSGDLANLCRADGFLEIPAGDSPITDPDQFRFFAFRQGLIGT